MKIKQIRIENFGKLSGYSLNLSEGINTIIEENGWGKSTLAAFIRIMFYGFENEGAKKDADFKNERKRYRPWNGGSFGGSIIFETGEKGTEKEYRLTRIFGANEKEDSFELYDNRTFLTSRDYSSRIGEELFGLDAESFKKTVFISQNDIETESTGSISAKLGNISSSMDDISSFSLADEELKNMLNSLSSVRRTGAIYAKKEEKSGLESDVRLIPVLEHNIETEENRINELKKIVVYADAEALKLNKELETASRSAALLSMKAHYEAILEREARKLLEKQAAEKPFVNGLPKKDELFQCIDLAKKLSIMEREYAVYRAIKTKESPIWIVLLALGIVVIALGAAGIVLSNLNDFYSTLGAAGIAAGLVMAVSGIIVKISGNKKRTEQELSSRISVLKPALENYVRALGFEPGDNLVDCLEEIRRLLDDFLEAEEDLEEVILEKNEFEKSCDINAVKDAAEDNRKSIEEIGEKIRALSQKKNEIKDSIAAYASQYNELLKEKDELTAKEERLKELSEEIDALAEKERLIGLTREFLSKAKSSFISKYSAPVASGFRKYYKMLEGDTGENYSFDADMNLLIEDHGTYRNLQLYSEGSKDKISLCFRLALIDAMFKGEKPVIIMDDPFTNLDEKHMGKGKELLGKLKDEYQILYLTCHESRKV